ncbi:TonB family protein [Pedobacter gandavensis]|uniref:TonB family protein n=1 Tax=Pedobacter gandavensis TaxID=2679963 RepID=UPI00292CC9C9|nr:TonB family protein [Pedobacter gandavensis]
MSWAHYILQANIYLVVFYGFYKLFLANETYFTMNRIYLVMSGILSLAIPFLRFEWFTKQPVTQPIYAGVDQLQDFVTLVSMAPEAQERFSTGSLLVIVYLAGIMICSLLFLYKLIMVSKLLKRNTIGNAYSFFSRKRIDPSLPEIDTIDKHEEIHIRQLHSMDILFFELLSIFTWFNPVIYGYKSSIKNTHEYLADEEAAKFQGDKEQYVLLLLSRSFKIAPNSLTNTFFNRSLIKKRIFMLHKQRSTKTAILKYGLFIPLFAITLMLSAATIRSNEAIIAVTEEIPLNEPLAIVKEVIHLPLKNELNTKVKPAQTIDPKHPRWIKFYEFARKNLRYPTEAAEKGIQGYSQVKFNLKNGQVNNFNILNKLGEGFEDEILKILTTYQSFSPAQNGNYTLAVLFKISGNNSPIKNPKLTVLKGYQPLNTITLMTFAAKMPQNQATSLNGVVIDPNDNKVYDFVSVNSAPTFPGGMANFYKYLRSTVKYPKEAQEKNVQGKVFLSFVVEKDGMLSDIKVEKKLGAGTDEEAIRILKQSPKWIPGIQKNKIVRVKLHIPINFSLTK